MNAVASRLAKLEARMGARETNFERVLLCTSRPGHEAEDERACCAAHGVEPGPSVLVLQLIGVAAMPSGATT